MRYRDFVIDFSPSPFGGDQYDLIVGGGEALLFEERPRAGQTGLVFTEPGRVLREWKSATPPPGVARESPPRSIGSALWESLPGPARDRLATAVASSERTVGNEREPVETLRLKVSTRPSLPGDFPWELLTPGSDGLPFGLRRGVQVVRSVPVRVPVAPRLVREPTALVVVSSPRVKAGISREVELDVVARAVEAGGLTLHVLKEPATFAAVAAELRKVTPHVLHFIGHAALNRSEGQLVFEGPQGLAEWVSPGRLATLLPPQTRLICLSSPVTARNYQILGFLRTALAGAEIPLPTMVVGQFEVREASARIYWSAFYRALLRENGDVNRAAWLASHSQSVALPNSPDWSGFAVVIRDGDARPFQLAEQPAEAFDPARRALEIEAALRARQTNALTEQIRRAGNRPTEYLRNELDSMRSKAEQLNNRILHDRK